MGTFLWILLFLGLFLALKKIREQNRIVRNLNETLRNSQVFLLNENRGFLGNAHWRIFCKEVNALIEERNKILSERAGRLGQLQATLEHMKEAVLIIDEADIIILANSAFRRLFDPPGDVRGRPVGTVLRASVFLDYAEEVKEGKAEEVREIDFRAPSGVISVEVSGSPIPRVEERALRLTLFLFHDITRLKQLESVRQEFVANVSHELRTPLSIIKGYIETLAHAEAVISDEERMRFLKILEKHADRLHLLLEDLLILSRLENKTFSLNREAVPVASLIREVVTNYEETGLTLGHPLVLDLDAVEIPVFADAPRIIQVLENLVNNAIKYSDGKLPVEIGSRREGDGVKIWVKDRGIGIGEKDLPHVFERFYRADKSRSREKGGTGLGLSIVKHIIQQHKGEVWAESTLGEGTTISFRLPIFSPALKEVNEGAGEAEVVR
ncbi:MAG: ATP-binding protein [Opitutales bacterium]